jgi:hypothetical protein
MLPSDQVSRLSARSALLGGRHPAWVGLAGAGCLRSDRCFQCPWDMAFAAAQRERADALRYQAAQNFLYFADRIADFAAKNGLPVKRDAGVRKISGLDELWIQPSI